MSKIIVNNDIDLKTGCDISANLDIARAELELLLVLFGNYPGMIVEPEDILPGVEAVLYDIQSKLNIVNHRLFHGEQEATS